MMVEFRLYEKKGKLKVVGRALSLSLILEMINKYSSFRMSFFFFFLFFFLPLFSYFILHSVFLVLFFLFYVWVVNGIELQSSFSSCYDHNSKQEEIFRNDVEPMLDVVYTGVVCCFVIYVRGVSFD